MSKNWILSKNIGLGLNCTNEFEFRYWDWNDKGAVDQKLQVEGQNSLQSACTPDPNFKLVLKATTSMKTDI